MVDSIPFKKKSEGKWGTNDYRVVGMKPIVLYLHGIRDVYPFAIYTTYIYSKQSFYLIFSLIVQSSFTLKEQKIFKLL